MRKLTCYALFLIAFIACNNPKKTDQHSETASVDTLSYTYASVQASYAPKNAGDTALAAINYPVFANKALNEYLMQQVFNFFSMDEKATSYQDIANSFISGYKDFTSASPNPATAWYLNIDLKVLRQAKNYIAITYRHDDFAGGAHGNSYLAYLNYNTKTNTNITLESLFADAQRKELTTIAETIFRKNEGLTPAENLTEKYFFEEGKFSLAKNFYVDKKGLVFLYNNYEIKPYVDGSTVLIIPLNKIKNLIKPNSLFLTLP